MFFMYRCTTLQNVVSNMKIFFPCSNGFADLAFYSLVMIFRGKLN